MIANKNKSKKISARIQIVEVGINNFAFPDVENALLLFPIRNERQKYKSNEEALLCLPTFDHTLSQGGKTTNQNRLLRT